MRELLWCPMFDAFTLEREKETVDPVGLGSSIPRVSKSKIARLGSEVQNLKQHLDSIR